MKISDPRHVAAITKLAECNIPPDVQELLVSGDRDEITPGVLAATLQTVLDWECPGADDPEERCPREPHECVCWEVDNDHPMRKAAIATAPVPTHDGSGAVTDEMVEIGLNACSMAYFQWEPSGIARRCSVSSDDVRSILEAVFAAHPLVTAQPDARVKVKPLEWAEYPSFPAETCWFSNQPLCTYAIDQDFGSDAFYYEVRRSGSLVGTYDGLPEAKEAAQADYANGILSALDRENKELREEIVDHDPLRAAVADYMRDTQTLPLEDCAKLFSLRIKSLSALQQQGGRGCVTSLND